MLHRLFPHRTDRGFTLIELLAVISIVSFLSTFILTAATTARGKSRDGQRVEDLQAIKTALGLYYLDHGHYPNCDDYGYAGGCDLQNFIVQNSYGDSSGDGHFMEFLKPYMNNRTLHDPVNDMSTSFVYIYGTDVEYPINSGKRYPYALAARLENPGQVQENNNDVLQQYGFYAVFP